MTENPGREAYRKEHGSRMQPGRGLPGPQDVLNGPEAELSDTLSAYPHPWPGKTQKDKSQLCWESRTRKRSLWDWAYFQPPECLVSRQQNNQTLGWSPPEDQPKGFPCFRVMGFIKMNKSTSWLLASKSPAIVWVLPEGNPRQRFQGKQFI